MQVQRIARGGDQARPYVDAGWLPSAKQPFRLTIDVPLSADVAAAALYDDPIVSFDPDSPDPARISSDAAVREAVAAAITGRGAFALQTRTDELAKPGGARQPGWLAYCRQRATEALPGLDGEPTRREPELDWEAGA